MTGDFHGKVFAVTGGASGIGLATCKILIERGATVAIADIQEKRLLEVAAEFTESGGKVTVTRVDVSDRIQVDAWIAATVSRFGKLDGAANLAGVMGNQSGVAGVENIDDEDWALVLGVNLTGMMHCLRAEIPHMKSSASIVNATSTLGLIGMPMSSAYSVSKHGIIGLSKSAAKEVGARGIRVNCVAPGPIDTPLFQANAPEAARTQILSNMAIKRLGNPSEVGETVAWLLSDSSSFITGSVQLVDGGWLS